MMTGASLEGSVMEQFVFVVAGIFGAFVCGAWVDKKRYGWAATMALVSINCFLRATVL